MDSEKKNIYTFILSTRKLVFNLVKELRCSVVVPLYPRTPPYTYKDTYPILVDFYKSLIYKVIE